MNKTMNTINNGGPINPVILKTSTDDGLGKTVEVATMTYLPGLTARRWLAALAMQQILSNHQLLVTVTKAFNGLSTRTAVAEYAYGLADAMLEVENREETQPSETKE